MFDRYAVVGELALEGSTRPARGALSIAMSAAQQRELDGLLVPSASAAEAAVVEGIEVIPVGSLAEAIGFLNGELEIAPAPAQLEQLFESLGQYEVDFSDVRGQEMAKRAITVAAAGSHNLLMVGPPGSGKTMLAKRMPTILPQLSSAESIETSRIYSAVGLLPAGQPLVATRPFRAPHHTISNAGLVGGGSVPAPGEISFSHHGVLFLDELPEFNRQTLEVLRQPLEDRTVTISRALTSTTFPANFMLIAALNPCPCGFRNDPRRECHCSIPQVERYMAKISGPLLDRIDLQLEVPSVAYRELSSTTPGTSSTAMRAQVESARARQHARLSRGKPRFNGNMSHREIREHCRLDSKCQDLLKGTMNELGLSARAHDKILRVARTIADLGEAENITTAHLSEAINYRLLDRSFWT